MKSRPNNNNKKASKNAEQLIDVKAHSIQDLYSKAEQEYQRISSAAQNKWYSIISRGGTKKDKINLMANEIISNPHTSLQQFEELAKWCFDANHNFALDSCKTLVNIYHDYVFADKNSLRIFIDSVQAVIKENKKKSTVTPAELVGFYLQHHIKTFYGEIIKSLEMLLNSTISFVKKTALTLLTSLTKHAELRRFIINILINKFGDQDMEIVNQVYKSLKNEFYQDLESSNILLQSAQALLFRANISRKSQFYVINFLNNLNMKFLNEKGLSKLFELFYHFFEKLMGEENKQNSVSSRLFLNAIKGLNKIFTFIKGGNKETKALIQSKIESVYSIVHKTTNTKAKIQLYLFLFQYHSHIHGNLTDRYYRSLYDFIGNDEILHCSLAELFFDLVLVSIKQDENINRILAFLKRMLQLCLTAQANFIATTLIMIGKIIEQKQSLRIVLKQKQNCMADESQQTKLYDMAKREPLYAGAETTLLWEVATFVNHYHPTVRKFAAHIINGESIPYDGANPMLELSTTSFLEKMVLKKEKKSDAWKLKNRKNLSKIRKSKYETLVDKPLDNFKEDEKFIQKYLKQREVIHTNFKKRQTTDIEEFADEVIQREMDRLNPKDNVDLSFSDAPEDEEAQNFEEQEFGGEEQGGEGEEGDDQFEDQEFGSDDEPLDDDQEFGDEDLEGQDDEDAEDDEEIDDQSEQKEFEQAFQEIGNDDDDYPRKGKNQKSKPSRPARKSFTKPIKKNNQKGKYKKR